MFARAELRGEGVAAEMLNGIQLVVGHVTQAVRLSFVEKAPSNLGNNPVLNGNGRQTSAFRPNILGCQPGNVVKQILGRI